MCGDTGASPVLLRGTHPAVRDRARGVSSLHEQRRADAKACAARLSVEMLGADRTANTLAVIARYHVNVRAAQGMERCAAHGRL